MRRRKRIQPSDIKPGLEPLLASAALIKDLAAEEDFAVVGDVGSGAEAVLLAANLVPDVILMDLVMPGMNGVEATRRIKHISPRSQIIVLTSYYDDEHLFPALRAGALSYLLKDVPLSELADAIRKAARGEAMIHPQVAARLVQEQEQKKSTPHCNVTLYTLLSDREHEVLHLIAEGCSNAEIGGFCISPRYACSLPNIREKKFYLEVRKHS